MPYHATLLPRKGRVGGLPAAVQISLNVSLSKPPHHNQAISIARCLPCRHNCPNPAFYRSNYHDAACLALRLDRKLDAGTMSKHADLRVQSIPSYAQPSGAL
jgi:hypothetical protein